MNPEPNPNLTSHTCSECRTQIGELPTQVEFDGHEIHLFHPVLCADCLLSQCETYSADCANCGGKIPPYSQVGVLKADQGKTEYIHLTHYCNTAGSAFYGYWGKGQLRKFVQVEAC